MRFKYYMIGGIALAIIVGGIIFYKKSGLSMKQFAAYDSSKAATKTTGASGVSASDNVDMSQQPVYYCPKPEDLVKDNTRWTTPDRKWQTYTPSSATKILSFLGAQWVGIKVGKIICLYKSNEAVSFPVALEQTRSQLILEPKGVGWSALVKNRKFCKSANIADCAYYIKPPKDISNIYEEIKYAPIKNDGN